MSLNRLCLPVMWLDHPLSTNQTMLSSFLSPCLTMNRLEVLRFSITFALRSLNQQSAFRAHISYNCDIVYRLYVMPRPADPRTQQSHDNPRRDTHATQPSSCRKANKNIGLNNTEQTLQVQDIQIRNTKAHKGRKHSSGSVVHAQQYTYRGF